MRAQLDLQTSDLETEQESEQETEQETESETEQETDCGETDCGETVCAREQRERTLLKKKCCGPRWLLSALRFPLGLSPPVFSASTGFRFRAILFAFPTKNISHKSHNGLNVYEIDAPVHSGLNDYGIDAPVHTG